MALFDEQVCSSAEIGELYEWSAHMRGYQVGVYSTSSVFAVNFALLREGDDVGSTAESESEITSWKQD